MALIPISRSSSEQKTRMVEPETLVERELEISKVSFFAEGSQNGKIQFSVCLEFETESNPSNQTRRTEEITGLALAVEEKEIPVLARLAGRRVGISFWKSKLSFDLENQSRTIQTLLAEIENLRKKNEILSENLHHAWDQVRQVS
jgi:hypothetical protein